MKKLASTKTFIALILALLLLMTALYTKCLIRYYSLKASLNSWVQFAASTSAFDDYGANQVGFYEVNMTVTNKTIVGSREGYPVRAWAFPQDAEGYNRKFVDGYNTEMEQLINSKNKAR